VRKNPGLTMVVVMPKGGDLGLQRLHPALQAELGGGVSGIELKAGKARA
jgi:hypothetical protein